MESEDEMSPLFPASPCSSVDTRNPHPSRPPASSPAPGGGGSYGDTRLKLASGDVNILDAPPINRRYTVNHLAIEDPITRSALTHEHIPYVLVIGDPHGSENPHIS